MRLALDHHYTTEIAAQLRRRRHDVVAAVENGWERLDDDALLKVCADERRALLTNNVADFAPLARAWMAEGRTHLGLIFTSDVSLPRHRGTSGRYVTRLDRLMRANPTDDALVNRVEWLWPSADIAAAAVMSESEEFMSLPTSAPVGEDHGYEELSEHGGAGRLR